MVLGAGAPVPAVRLALQQRARRVRWAVDRPGFGRAPTHRTSSRAQDPPWRTEVLQVRSKGLWSQYWGGVAGHRACGRAMGIGGPAGTLRA